MPSRSFALSARIPTEGRLARFMIVANPMLGRANAMVYGGAALGGLLAWLVSP